jgi:hypothetical protein
LGVMGIFIAFLDMVREKSCVLQTGLLLEFSKTAPRVLVNDPELDNIYPIGPILESDGTKFKWLRGISVVGDVVYGLPCHVMRPKYSIANSCSHSKRYQNPYSVGRVVLPHSSNRERRKRNDLHLFHSTT